MRANPTHVPFRDRRKLAVLAAGIGLFLASLTGAAQSTNQMLLPTPTLAPAAMPDIGLSLLRVLGALAIVLAVFLGGVWLFRNWQRLVIHRGRAPRLNVLEVRSLGGRHALYVVGYEQERFLIASSPAGVNLVSHLQSVETDGVVETDPAKPSFAQALVQTLKGK
jgi:flagellar biogenesis protein FliO